MLVAIDNNAKRFKERRDETSYSLNLETYRKEVAELEKENEELKNKFVEDKFKVLDFGLGKTNEKVKLNITNDTASTLSSIKKQTKELKENFRNTNEIYKTEVEIKRLDGYLDTLDLGNPKIFLKINQ